MIGDINCYTETAALPIAGITALQALIRHGALQPGETVLVNGAAGGVGHIAVQLAKAFGANVTAVCSQKNIGFIQSLGADAVIPYDDKSLSLHKDKYDLVVDVHGSLNYEDYKRLGKRGVMVGFTGIGRMMRTIVMSLAGKFSLKQFTAEVNTDDLELLALMVQKAKVKVHLENVYSFERIPEAVAHIETGVHKGKVAMVWEEQPIYT